MNIYTAEQMQYFKENIDIFSLEEKKKLINTNLKQIILDDLRVICVCLEDKELTKEVFEIGKGLFSKDDLKYICEYSRDENTRIEAFNLGKYFFDKYDLINICGYGEDENIRIEANKLLNINNKQITKEDFIT